MDENKYPYLGRHYVNDKSYVVLFTEPETGVVVMSEVNTIKFGSYLTFDETLFEILPPNICVRLSN